MARFSTLGLSLEDRVKFPELERLIVETTSRPTAKFQDLMPVLKQFIESKFIRNFLIDELTSIANASEYNRLGTTASIEIISLPQYTVQLGRLQGSKHRLREGGEVSSYANDVLYYNLGPAAFSYILYQAPKRQRNEVFDRASLPAYIGEKSLSPGESAYFMAGVDIIKIIPDENDIFQVTVTSREQQSLEWHYDYVSLVPLYCSAGKNGSSAIQHALNILVKLGADSAGPALMSAFSSEDHFVRWSAVRAALALDENVGLELLKRAKLDFHPHVRSAAQKAEKILQHESGKP